jgi:hypothetical protein
MPFGVLILWSLYPHVGETRVLRFWLPVFEKSQFFYDYCSLLKKDAFCILYSI